MSQLVNITFFKGNNFLPVVFLLLAMVCGTSCSEKDNNILSVDSSEINSEAGFSLQWLGVWKGTANYIDETYYVGPPSYRTGERNYTIYESNNKENVHCIITITKISSNQIFFTMSEPFLFQGIVTVVSDSSCNYNRVVNDCYWTASVSRNGNELIGTADKRRIITVGRGEYKEVQKATFLCFLHSN